MLAANASPLPIPRWAKSGKTKSSEFGWGEIFERDGKRCVYCLKDLSVDIDGLLSITQDHLFPQSQGGGNHLANLVTCCAVCNGLKRHLMPNQKDWKSRKMYIQACRQMIDTARKERIKRYEKYLGRKPAEVFDSSNPNQQDYI